MNSYIKDIEYYLPNKIISSDDLEKKFSDFDREKVENKIGIYSRCVTEQGETTLDLAYNASYNILQRHKGITIDFILLCTQTPDYILPTGACILQDKLGLSKGVGALDFNLGCSGYVYGLALVKGLIATGVAKNVLFVTADTYTKVIHEDDKGNRSIFGDGATATIVSTADSIQIKEFCLGTDGSGFDKLIVKNGGLKNPYDATAREMVYGNDNKYTDNCLFMNGPDVFNFTIKNIPKLITDTLKKNNIDLESIDYFIFHQANQFMLEYLRKKIKIPKEKFYIDLRETGNTVSSTIPIALKKSLDNNTLKNGDTVLLAGFGVGLSWGATIVKI